MDPDDDLTEAELLRSIDPGTDPALTRRLGRPKLGSNTGAVAGIKRKRDALLQTVRELAHKYKDFPDSTQRIGKDIRRTPMTVRKLRRAAGVPAQRGTGQLEPKARSPLDTTLAALGWNILNLFDTLMGFFETVEQTVVDHDIDDEAPPPPPQDMRRTWIAWRVFLAAAFGLPQDLLATDQGEGKSAGSPMPEYPGVTADCPRGAAELPPGARPQDIFERCTNRHTWPRVQARLVSLVVGRRGGKSYITAIIGLYLACCRMYKLNLGTKGMVMILARDKEQAGVIRRYILAFLNVVPRLRGMLSDEPTQKLIELTNGITIEIRAVGEAGTRGYTVVAALADEIAFWPTDPDSAKQDRKVLRALRPAMLGIPGSMVVMLSSPYAKRGVLHENHQKFYGKDDQTRAFVWQADTLSMRPSDDPELIEEIRSEYEDDPDSARAEYGAAFRSDLESIYSRAAVESVSVPGRYEQPYRAGHVYRAFVDPSGGSSDSYVLAIAHMEKRKQDGEDFTLPVLDKVVEWKPKFDPEQVSREVVQICKDFHITSVTGDAYGGEWPRDPLKKRGIRYELSDMTRSELYLGFLPLVNSGRCELLDPEHHKRAVNQFSNLERRVGRTGRDSVDHPPGSHDDIANAIAGVMVVGGKGKALGAVW